jgi:hypothetical protein
MSYRFVDSFRAAAGSGWNCVDDGQRNCPKHVEFHFQNTFEKLVHLVSFIIRKFVTMHGHMNVKYVKFVQLLFLCRTALTLLRLTLSTYEYSA